MRTVKVPCRRFFAFRVRMVPVTIADRLRYAYGRYTWCRRWSCWCRPAGTRPAAAGDGPRPAGTRLYTRPAIRYTPYAILRAVYTPCRRFVAVP